MDIVDEILKHKDADRAVHSQRFFKTGVGEYGEGDLFLGVRVPQVRQIVNAHYKYLKIRDLNNMLNSKWHEVRLAAVIAMNKQFPKSSQKTALYNLYLKQIGHGINNWDIIDVSCPHIVGAYLQDKPRQPLYDLAKQGLWHKRVAIISTFYFLRYNGSPADTYNLAEILLYEKHDLLQKAVGWALREMGKKDPFALTNFLDKYAATMPRTALRYSLEKLNSQERSKYLNAARQI